MEQRTAASGRWMHPDRLGWLTHAASVALPRPAAPVRATATWARASLPSRAAPGRVTVSPGFTRRSQRVLVGIAALIACRVAFAQNWDASSDLVIPGWDRLLGAAVLITGWSRLRGQRVALPTRATQVASIGCFVLPFADRQVSAGCDLAARRSARDGDDTGDTGTRRIHRGSGLHAHADRRGGHRRARSGGVRRWAIRCGTPRARPGLCPSSSCDAMDGRDRWMQCTHGSRRSLPERWCPHRKPS